MDNLKALSILFLACFMVLQASGQSNKWKRMRYEFFGGLGVSNFMGELGGSNNPAKMEASHFLGDFEFSMTRPAFTLGMRYQIQRRLAAAYTISYGRLNGDDAKTANVYRQYRNSHFRSPIWETGIRYEYSLITTRKGHRYSLRNVRGRKGNKIDLAVFAGFNAIFFNPRGQFAGKWYSLQPLGTEGQNYAETRKPYSRFSFSVPIGVNVRYIINKKWSIAWEYGFRWAMSDYLDDVSTSYADPIEVAKSVKDSDKANAARYFADPSFAVVGDEAFVNYPELKYGVLPNEQRGNSTDRDIYMFSFITVNYKVKTGRNGLPRF